MGRRHQVAIRQAAERASSAPIVSAMTRPKRAGLVTLSCATNEHDIGAQLA
jgi:hypothetical protein